MSKQLKELLDKEGNLIIKQNKLFDDIYIKENNE